MAIDSESCRPRPSSPRRDPGHRERMEGEGERVVGGRGEGGKMKEGGGRKGRAPPSAARPDRSKTSRLLFRRRSLPPCAAHIGEKNKKQDVKDAALICPQTRRHLDVGVFLYSAWLRGPSQLASAGSVCRDWRSGDRFRLPISRGNFAAGASTSVAADAETDSRRTYRPVLPESVWPGRFELPRKRLNVS